MIAVMLILLPSLIGLLLVRQNGSHRLDVFELGASYLLLVLMVNLATMFAVLLSGTNEELLAKLNSYPTFGLKYAIISILFSVAFPMLFFWLRSNVAISFTHSWGGGTHSKAFAIALAVILFSLHFIRIFNYNFWGDEAFSVLLSRMDFAEMLSTTAADVHPPLFYALLLVSYRIFGDQGWMYNLISLLPLAITFVLSLTYIWRRFIPAASMLFMVLCTFMNVALTYNLEVRMYSWAALFVLLAFLCLYEILVDGKGRWYLGFTCSALAAAYTHYYAFLTVALMYLSLIVLSIVRRADVRKTAFASLGAILGYAPWLLVLLGTFSRTSDGFWMTKYPSFAEGIRWMFSLGANGSGTNVLLLAFAALAAITVLIGFGFVRIARELDSKWGVVIGFKTGRASSFALWVLSGVFAIVGTMLVGIAVSEFIRPMFTTRYLYPCAMVAWLMLAAMLGRCKPGNVVAALLALFVVFQGFPAYRAMTATERSQVEAQGRTVAAVEAIDGAGVMYTNDTHLSWTILECYFPGAEVRSIDETKPVALDAGHSGLLVLSGVGLSDYSTWLRESGFTAEDVCLNGNLGARSVNVYRLVPSQGGEA